MIFTLTKKKQIRGQPCEFLSSFVFYTLKRKVVEFDENE